MYYTNITDDVTPGRVGRCPSASRTLGSRTRLHHRPGPHSRTQRAQGCSWEGPHAGPQGSQCTRHLQAGRGRHPILTISLWAS